jgi:leader peptidase (prepilin peptidase)/N-methyltransferase
VPPLSEFPSWFVIGVAVLLGLALASFVNVVIYRLPRGESLARPGSRCPHCETPIRAWNNIPVLSWLLLHGKARCCGTRIPVRYPLIELLGGLFAWALVETIVFELDPATPIGRAAVVFLLYLALGLALVAAAFIDLEQMFLPDTITIGGTLAGILSVPLRPDIDFVDSLVGTLVGFLVVWLPFDLLYRLLRGQPGMGLGDAKLVMLAGAWFGWQGALFTLLAGAVQGTIGAIAIYVATGRIEEPEAVKKERDEFIARIEATDSEQERAMLQAELDRDPIGRPPESGLGKARLPFGPFLVLSTLEYLLFARLWVEQYLGGLGAL